MKSAVVFNKQILTKIDMEMRDSASGRCRTCYSGIAKSYSIHACLDFAPEKTLADLLFDIAQIETQNETMHNLLPKQLCISCVHSLRNAYDFAQQAREVNERYLSGLSELTADDSDLEIKMEIDYGEEQIHDEWHYNDTNTYAEEHDENDLNSGYGSDKNILVEPDIWQNGALSNSDSETKYSYDDVQALEVDADTAENDNDSASENPKEAVKLWNNTEKSVFVPIYRDKRYVCNICNTKFTQRKNCVRHWKRKHYNTTQRQTKNVKVKLKAVSYKKTLCKIEKQTETELKCMPIYRDNRYHCNVCNAPFTLRCNCIRHWKKFCKHKSSNSIKDGNDNSDVKNNAQDMVKHIKQQPNHFCSESSSPEAPILVIEDEDDYHRESESEMRFAPKLINGRYICDICLKDFAWRRSCTRHRLMHFETYNYHCTHCERKFQRSDSLKAHMQTHLTFTRRKR